MVCDGDYNMVLGGFGCVWMGYGTVVSAALQPPSINHRILRYHFLPFHPKPSNCVSPGPLPHQWFYHNTFAFIASSDLCHHVSMTMSGSILHPSHASRRHSSEEIDSRNPSGAEAGSPEKNSSWGEDLPYTP